MPDVFTPPSPDEVLETSFTPPSPTDVEDSFTPPAPDEVEPLVSPDQREHILSGLVEAGKRGEKQPTVPIVQLPRATMTQGPFPGQKLPSVAQIAGGIYNALAAVPEFLSTPQGVSTGMAAGLGGALGRVIAAGFSADLASHTPQQITELDSAIKSGDKMAISQKAAELGLSAAFIGATAKHAIKGPRVEAAPIVKEESAPAQETPIIEESAPPIAAEPKTITPDTFRDEINKASGNMGTASDALSQSLSGALGQGSKVTLTADGKTVPIVAIEGGMMTDAQGQRWGTMGLATAKDSNKNRIEITPAEPTVPAATTEQILGKTAEPELIGMGGATPSEFKPSAEKATSIKNASVDAERQARGQEPIMAPTRLRNEVVWDKAMAKIDSDPAWQDRLITELTDNPRTPSAEEIVALDHRYVDLQNEYAKATRDGAQHYADGFELGVVEAQTRAAFFESKLNELEQVSRKIGTEWGRSGQMRQRLMREDFSLAAMESKMRAAKGFAPLSLAEHAEIKVLHDKLAAAENKAVDVETAANKRIALVEAQKALAEAKTQSGQVAYEPRIIAAAERFATFMDRQADAARKRLKERLSRVSAGIDPTMLADVGIIGAAKITRGVVDIAKWTDEMASELGDWIRQHKDEAWAISNKTLEDKLSGFGEGKVQTEKLKRATGELARLTREKEELQARLMLEDYSPRRNKRTTPISKEIADARADVMLLREQFQRALDKKNYERKSKAEKIWMGTKEASNLIRATKTSYDVSAVFRQGGFITIGDPVLLTKAFVPMMRALKSERNAAAVKAEILSRPNATSGLYERAGLFLTQRAGAALSGMEEAYMSRLARNIPGVAASERAYVTFLDKLRADAFDDMYADLANGGEAALSDAKVIANAVNVMTGRGNVGNAAKAAESLSTVFFSPRLIVSRFQTFLGQPLYRGSMRAKYVIAKRYARFLLGLGAIYGLSKLAGATVEDDRRSADYRKLKFGNTRVDPTAGLAQASVFLKRFFSGQAKSGEKIYKKDQKEVVAEFLRNKLAPIPGAAWDIKDIATDTKLPPGHGEAGILKYVGVEDETVAAVTLGLPIPMTFEDIALVMQEQGVPAGTILSLLSMLGMSMQTYDSTKKLLKHPR